MKRVDVKLVGHIGKWYEIDRKSYNGEWYYLMEHQTFGGDAAAVIINGKNQVILEEVWNGFDDLEYVMEHGIDEWKEGVV